MRLKEKFIPYLIVAIPLTLVLTASFFITSFYLDKVEGYFDSAKGRAIKEHIDSKKIKSELWAKQLNLLFEYKYNKLEKGLKTTLQTKVQTASQSAKYIYEKYKNTKSTTEIKQRIVDTLKVMNFNDKSSKIFITDYDANIILGDDKKYGADYIDADNRSIVLEEIQSVRKHGQGYLRSRDFYTKQYQRILVKDLGVFNWFVGCRISESHRIDQLKMALLGMLSSIPLDNSNFMGLYEGEQNLFLSLKMQSLFTQNSLKKISKSLSQKSSWHQAKQSGYYYFSTYYKPLDWYLVYGFDISTMSKQEISKQKHLENLLDNELEFIVKVSASIVFFVVILSLILSKKINEIFKEYQAQVKQRTQELEDLNLFLENRVSKEVQAHREKEKILIQRSKMADMGDMLSMIAHQWRQPLNQMSYVFMNIESVCQDKNTDKKYLEEKLQEGTELLEFMSTTIDDFKNYFQPDKEKEFVLVSDIVKTSVALMKNPLKMNNIEIELHSQGRDLTHIYKNEFTQVILNLIKNAKDVLTLNKIQNPKITISSISQNDKLVVKVCDNGGGVHAKIRDKIFEPYFSTKDKKSGTGLGLYMSKMIIEEHMGGELEFVNTKNGACFIVKI